MVVLTHDKSQAHIPKEQVLSHTLTKCEPSADMSDCQNSEQDHLGSSVFVFSFL